MDIEGSLKTGFEKTKQRNGLILIAVFFVINLVSTIVAQSQAAQAMERFGQFFEELPSDFREMPMQEIAIEGPLALDLPPALLSLMNLASLLAGLIAIIVAYRVFASGARDRIPDETYSNLLIPSVNAIISIIIFAIIIVVVFVVPPILGGFVLGASLINAPANVAPSAITVVALIALVGFALAIYITIALVFFLPLIALEDNNFIEAFGSSWQLTKGNRLSVFLLLVAVGIVRIVISILGGIVSGIVSFIPVLGSLVTIAVGSALTVFTLAVIFEAYRQLRERRTGAAI
jgi:hypothetical protein